MKRERWLTGECDIRLLFVRSFVVIRISPINRTYDVKDKIIFNKKKKKRKNEKRSDWSSNRYMNKHHGRHMYVPVDLIFTFEIVNPVYINGIPI